MIENSRIHELDAWQLPVRCPLCRLTDWLFKRIDYKLPIKGFPDGRSGTAIPYSRWSRTDRYG